MTSGDRNWNKEVLPPTFSSLAQQRQRSLRRGTAYV
jgi:hypothetical protein